jgi:hypothetical protein
MGLFEILTGYVGCSFERCYVWAANGERAMELFRERFTHREAKEIRLLVRSDDQEFITRLDDEGFRERIGN